jgi:polyisoprenoid-binding protein YceI
MNTRKNWNTVALLASLLATVITGVSAEEEVCASFMDGKVDESVLETMLNAAHEGHLYRMNAATSKVGFCVSSKLKRVTGDFHDFQGGIALTGEGAGEAQTLVAIRTGSLDTDAPAIENLLKGERFFDVTRFPEILFVSTGFKWTSSTGGLLRGDLTLRGITRPVIFRVTLADIEGSDVATGRKILVKATTTINRSEFGMDTLSKLVSDDVQLCMSVEADKLGA